jgi:hypothetical protein
MSMETKIRVDPFDSKACAAGLIVVTIVKRRETMRGQNRGQVEGNAGNPFAAESPKRSVNPFVVGSSATPWSKSLLIPRQASLSVRVR